MTWFKVDDSFYRSGKVRKLGKDRVAAVGLWTLAGDWAADNLTDGFVPWEVIEDWDTNRRLSSRLVAVGLWFETELDGESGCQFHDWADWQPTRDQVIQRRKSDAERRARWREARRGNGVPPDGPSGGQTQESRSESRRDTQRESREPSHTESRTGSVLPDPTRPDPTRISTKEAGPVEDSTDGSVDPNSARKRAPRPPATRIPDDFAPDGDMVAWVRKECPDVDGRRETETFIDYWRAKPGKDGSKLDWLATWRNWMRRAQTDQTARRPLRVVGGRPVHGDGVIRDPRTGRAIER